MANLFNSSIGKKIIMSLSGIFLITFIIVHLSVNLLLLVGDGTVYNLAAHFMDKNPIIGVIEPILGIGFLFHIVYSVILTLQNYFARPLKYKVISTTGATTWASRNMFILGGLILSFLIMHIVNFYWKIKFGGISTLVINGQEINDTYSLVTQLFKNYWWYDLIYISGAFFLGLHLNHGVWSAFQTIGLNNDIWLPRLKIIARIFAIIIAAGFSLIPLFFLISSNI